MQKTKEPTDSANYAVRFGGVWLEYHERIQNAERELSTAKYLCDEVTVERDLLLAEKLVLEQKFKESIASLTQTATDHLEAKQIVDQVRDEQKSLATRCLAAEAHTEWLEDQVKQYKVNKSIKEEEVASLQFRIENLKSSVADGEAVQDTLRKTLSDRDTQITSLQSLLKARDEEILVQSRSLHSKDRQLAQVVRERNAFKDDLTDTQRALALARRTGAVSRKCDSSSIKVTAIHSTASSAVKCRASAENTPCENSILDTTTNTTTSTHTAAHTSSSHTAQANAATVLRKYKSSLQSRQSGINSSSDGAIDTTSVLLEDILLSVLSPEPAVISAVSGSVVNSNTADTGCIVQSTADTSSCMDSSVDVSLNMSMDVAAETDVRMLTTNTTTNSNTNTNDNTNTSNNANDNSTNNTNTHVLSTPIAGRKSPVTLSDAPTLLNPLPLPLHLDELDLDYINDILDTPGHTVCKSTVVQGVCGVATRGGVSRVDSSMSNSGVSSSGSVDPAVQTLFGASPVAVKSGRVSMNSNTSNSVGSRVSNGASVSVGGNPWAMRKSATPSRHPRSSAGSVGNVVSRASSTTKPHTNATNTNTNTTTDNTTNNDNNTATTTTDLAAYIQREHDYKAALYLLQEEVRLLHTQIASYEQAKRTVRGTPKKSTKCTAHSTAGGAVLSSVGTSSVSVSNMYGVHSVPNSMHHTSSVGTHKDVQCMNRDSMCRFNQHGSGAFKGKVLFA